MTTPKRRHSKARSRKRRSHLALKKPEMVNCPNCQELMVPHRACPSCGFYDGRMIPGLEKEEKE